MASPVDLSTILQVHQCWTHPCTKMTVQDWDSTKGFFFIFNFLKNSRSHLSSYLFHPFEFCLQTCHSLHFREVLVFSLNFSLFDTDSARFVLKFLFFVSLDIFFHRKAIFLFLFFENFRTILIC